MPRRRRDGGCRGDIGPCHWGWLPAGCLFAWREPVLWRGRAGSRPGSRLPFLGAPRKGSQRRRWNTSFRAFCSGASATNPPHDHCLQLHRDRTRHGPCPCASARFASAQATTSSSRRKSGPTVPVGTGLRRCDRGGRASKASNAHSARDRQASEARPQIKPARDPPSLWAPACASVTEGASEQSEQRPPSPATGRRAERSRRSSHTRARLGRATRGSPSGGPARERRRGL